MPLLPVRLPAWALTLAGVCAVTGLALVAVGLLPAPSWPAIGDSTGVASVDERAAAAEARMREAARAVYRAKREAGAFIDGGGPPEAVALVGSELTPLVTTLGSLEAKRVASSPVWAHRLTTELARAGVGPDTVAAATFSGSFPGLNLAVVCAAQALGARVVAVSSVTASTWGATDPGFTWPEIEARLVEAGVIPAATVGVSIGGDRDVGLDLEPEARALAERIADDAARRLGADRLRTADLDEAVAQRVALLERRAGRHLPVVYVNVGGTTASLGQDDAVLRLRSGWLAPGAARLGGNGLLARFAERGVPVLHLLNVREIAARWGVAR